jgi:saccharopine dehydrogenase-like NADP-dependent oxidoreductase
MPNVTVLGGGRVGGAIALDLAGDPGIEVTVVDASRRVRDRLARHGMRVTAGDLSDPEAVRRVAAECDLVIGAVPGVMGFETLQGVIGAGTNAVDISFFPEDAYRLDAAARQQGVTAVVDCGVAPGLSNMIHGYAGSVFDRVDQFACAVGGLPVHREPPWEYRAPFSPLDVIEEYTRPARLRRGGELLSLPALSEVELLGFDTLGVLEAFNTDGLRTLLVTSDTPTMVEKTLRYPGHAAKIAMLRDTGFFGTDAIPLGGGAVRPLDLTTQLLIAQWQMRESDRDLTVMRVTVDGERAGKGIRWELNLVDRYDEEGHVSSMARTTGYTCSAVARLVLEGRVTEKGIVAPEVVAGMGERFRAVLAHLGQRGISFDWRDGDGNAVVVGT